jgi:hypothetical protein
VSDLHHQPSAVVEVLRCFHQNAPHQIESVAAAGQRQHGFMAEFGGQCAHRADADIRRIGKDQVVLKSGQFPEQVRLF